MNAGIRMSPVNHKMWNAIIGTKRAQRVGHGGPYARYRVFLQLPSREAARQSHTSLLHARIHTHARTCVIYTYFKVTVAGAVSL